jgi:tetratricopeptide (TPR) repeat protein
MGLPEQLAYLESAELVRLVQVQPELEYLFRHAMVQDAAYSSLLKHNRRALHYLIGETLERIHAERTDDIAAVLAHHFAEADDTRRAVKYYVRAGELAARQYANAEALLHFSNALEIVRRVAERSAPSLAQEADLICRLLAGRGRIYEVEGKYEIALADYFELEALGVALADGGILLTALMAQATLRTTPTPIFDARLGLELLDRALTLARGRSELAAQAKIRWTQMLLVIFGGSGDWDEARTAGEEALMATRQILQATELTKSSAMDSQSLRSQLAFILHDIYFVYQYYGQIPLALDALNEAAGLFRSQRNLPMLAETLVFICHIYLLTGQYDDALRYSESARQIGEEARHEYSQAYSQMMIGRVYSDRGHLSQAATLMADAIALCERSNNFALSLFTQPDLAMLYGVMGDLPKGLVLAEGSYAYAVRALPQFQGMALGVLARLHLMAGDFDAARASIDVTRTRYGDYRQLKARLGSYPPAMVGTLLAYAEFALAHSDLAVANEILTYLLVELTQTGMRHFLPEAELIFAKARLAAGDMDGARQALVRARSEAEMLGARRWLLPICVMQSELAALGGLSSEAAALRAEAGGHLSFIAEQITDATLRESFVHRNRVTGQPEGA